MLKTIVWGVILNVLLNSDYAFENYEFGDCDSHCPMLRYSCDLDFPGDSPESSLSEEIRETQLVYKGNWVVEAGDTLEIWRPLKVDTLGVDVCGKLVVPYAISAATLICASGKIIIKPGGSITVENSIYFSGSWKILDEKTGRKFDHTIPNVSKILKDYFSFSNKKLVRFEPPVSKKRPIFELKK